MKNAPSALTRRHNSSSCQAAPALTDDRMDVVAGGYERLPDERR
jgi:hypothetical protein